MFYYFLDTEAPTFEACPINQTRNTDTGLPTVMLAWENPSATDNSGDISEVTCDPPPRTKFVIGQTLVTCVAVDSSGNNNTCSFQINVKGM